MLQGHDLINQIQDTLSTLKSPVRVKHGATVIASTRGEPTPKEASASVFRVGLYYTAAVDLLVLPLAQISPSNFELGAEW